MNKELKQRIELEDTEGQVIADGGWRGDICSQWKNLGFGPDKIEDFYP